MSNTKSQEDYNNILDTYDKIAQFADNGYQQVNYNKRIAKLQYELREHFLGYVLYEVRLLPKESDQHGKI